MWKVKSKVVPVVTEELGAESQNWKRASADSRHIRGLCTKELRCSTELANSQASGKGLEIENTNALSPLDSVSPQYLVSFIFITV